MSQFQAIPSLTVTQIALRFVGELQAGRRPSIEAALDSAPSTEWGGLLQSLLIAEVNHRRSRGETPVAREYLPRFPAHTSVVRSVIAEVRAVVGSATVAPPPARRLVPPALPPAAIILPDEFEDIEPLPDPAARWQRRRHFQRIVAFVAMAIVLAGITLFVAIRRGKKSEGNAPPPSTTTNATAPPLTSNSLFAPKPRAPDPERELAEWIVGVGGRGTLAMDTGGRRIFSPEAPLPKARFTVTGIVLPAESSVRWSAADLGRLRDRDRLSSLELHHPTALGDWVLDVLSGSPLRRLELHGTAVTVTGAAIARFANLETLIIQSSPAFSDADMAAIGNLTKLASLKLNAAKLTPAGLGELKRTSLRSLSFGEIAALTPDHIRVLQGLPLEEFESANGMTDDAILEFATFQGLKRLHLQRTSITDAGLRVAAGFGMLEELQITGSSITGAGLDHLTDRKSLRVLDLTNAHINDEGVEKLLALPGIKELRLAGCPITDRGVMLLAQVDGVQILDLSRTNITDMALGILKKHQTLQSLILNDTRVTARAVSDFEQATPNCKVAFGMKK